jgi:hypothetical protein
MLAEPDVYHCYLAEREQRKQPLLVVSTGQSTALDHLAKVHKTDRAMGLL